MVFAGIRRGGTLISPDLWSPAHIFFHFSSIHQQWVVVHDYNNNGDHSYELLTLKITASFPLHLDVCSVLNRSSLVPCSPSGLLVSILVTREILLIAPFPFWLNSRDYVFYDIWYFLRPNQVWRYFTLLAS